jgi:subtilisin family serine protease
MHLFSLDSPSKVPNLLRFSFFLSLLTPYSLGDVGQSELIGNREAFSERVIVRYKSDVRSQDSNILANQMGALGATEARVFREVPGLAVLQFQDPILPQSSGVGERVPLINKIKELEASGLFEYVEPDWRLSIKLEPEDLAYNDGRLWGLKNDGANGGQLNADINASEAWNYTTGNKSVVVGVIDTGIRYTHQDLADNMWKNPNEIAGDGIDNDNNGYVDDVYGLNALNASGDPFDDNGHGTHCAGTIGAAANNGFDHVGVAWSTQLMALKFLDADGFGSLSGAMACIEYAIANGADIINASYGGGGFSQAMADLIAAAGESGVLFVAAAGNESNNNDTNPSYPASYSATNVISVAAINRSDLIAGFSNFGVYAVDLAAPGVDIFSAIADSDSSYGFYSGTSMAAPHVSGVAALIKSYYPGISISESRTRIIDTARTVADLQSRTASGGTLDALQALAAESDGELELSLSVDESDSILLSGEPALFLLSVRDLSTVLGATVTGSIEGLDPIEFMDTGVEGDIVASDGIYSSRIIIPESSTVLSLTVTVSAPGKITGSLTKEFAITSRPPNDRFENRQVLSGSESDVSGSNIAATLDSNEPVNPTSSGVHSVWWEWAALANGAAVITTVGSDFDTTLAVYEGSSLENLVLVASNDDFNGLTSKVSFAAQANTSYSIQLNGYAQSVGNIVLNYPSDSDGLSGPAIVGNPSDLTIVSGRAISLKVEVEGSEPFSYQWLKDDLAIEGATASTFVKASALPEDSGLYSVRVSNAFGAVTSSPAIVAVERTGVYTANDLFENAIELEPIYGTNGPFNVGLSSGEAGEPNHAGVSLPLNSLWWKWTAPSDGVFKIKTDGSDFDTTLAAYTGLSLLGLDEIASNDDANGLQSEVSINTIGGQQYYFAVDGYSSSVGAAIIEHYFEAAAQKPANDDFADKQLYDTSQGSLAGTNIGGSRENDEPVHFGENEPQSTSWWSFVAPSNSIASISTIGSSFDTVVSVYKGESLDQLVPVGWSDNGLGSLQSYIEFEVEKGGDYSFAVGGKDSQEGQIAVSVNFDAILTLNEATEASSDTQFSNSSNAWRAVRSVSSDGEDSIQSGFLRAGQASTISVELEGPSLLSFLWKVDSEENYDFLNFEVDQELQKRISGSTGWQRVEKILYGGFHSISWSYGKNEVISSGADAAWLDKMENRPLLDSDGDGVPNLVDQFPEDPSETTDTDGDGIGDNTDPYPNSLQTDIEFEGSIQIPTSWGSVDGIEWKTFYNQQSSILINIKSREQPSEWVLGLKDSDKLDRTLTGELYALESQENQYWNYLKKSKAPTLSFGNHLSGSLYFAAMTGVMTFLSDDIEYEREQRVHIFFDGTSRWDIVCYINKETATTAEREELDAIIDSVLSDRIMNFDEDSDGDGLSDFDEAIFYGSSPQKIDSNLDGFTDGEVVGLGGDPSYDLSGLVQLLKASPSRIELFSAAEVVIVEANARAAGQNDVTSDPGSYELYTESEVSTAEAFARTAGQNDVTSDPGSYELYTKSEVSAAEAYAITAGQNAVTSDPSSYKLHTESEVSIAEAFARTVGQSDVTSDPSSYSLHTAANVIVAAEAAKTIVNASARVALGKGEIVTPGFVVLGEQKKLLIRAVGPKLADLGVGSPLPNPTMTVYKTRYDGNPPDVVATIDDWKTDNDNVSEIVSAMSSAGAFPLEPTETFQGRPFMTDDTSSAATLVTLDIGVYTVQVSSADDGVGEVLVEVYEITD